MVGIGLIELTLICGLALVALVVVAGIGALIWWISHRGNTSISMSATPRETPRDILKARYARGEISKEQFEQIKNDLES